MPKIEFSQEEFEPRAESFHGFQDLTQKRIQDVILVSTLDDYYIISQDGRLNEQFFGEFLELDLRHNPNITRVFSGKKAIELARERHRYDLIITSIELADMNVLQLIDGLRHEGIQTPVVLLAHDRQELSRFIENNDVSPIERIFLWQGDARILLAIVKYVEDKVNAEFDSGVVGVPVIILVEDSIRYYSSFLPVIYAELVKHAQSLIPEGLNLTDKLMRIRAWPKILLSDHYEEAWDHFTKYSEDVLGIISDFSFPRAGEDCPDAGVQLAREIRKVRPDVPIMLQSAHSENLAAARSVGTSFLLKGSPLLLHQVRRFMIESLRIGDFVFRLPDGTEIGRAHDLETLEHMLETVPAESLAYHGERNDLSNWLKARAELELAAKLRPGKVSDFGSLEELREAAVRAIAEHRQERNRGQVVDFDRTTFDASASFYRIGGGSLGGKARGLAFINKLLKKYHIDRHFPGVTIAVPTAVVIGTAIFDRFIEDNDLGGFAIQCDRDEEIIIRFQRAGLPREVREDLAVFLDKATYPLAVRSSSLLEDSQYQPFAGVYQTFMLPNNHPDPDIRLEQLLSAVKRVYASTFSNHAKTFLDATQYRPEEEKMAVIIQKVVGSAHGVRFYPDFAGVARSYNFYPSEPAEGEDGIVAVALGLGKTVVDGGRAVRFCPKYPQHLLQLSTVERVLKNSQTEFYAIALDRNESVDCCVELSTWGLDAAEQDGTLAPIASTYSAENDAIYDGTARQGVRLVTFAHVLKHGYFPLATILQVLMKVAEQGTRSPVELEFAVDLDEGSVGHHEFGFLQLRPLALTREVEEVDLGGIENDQLVCRSKHVLGHGRLSDVKNVVVVDYEQFERRESRKTADTVGRLNAKLKAEGRAYLLIGVGRWGSGEPFLGIPVTWDQIAGARVIVEAGFRDLHVTPSQGTHFFQNLVSNSVGYFTVNPEEGFVDWDWLARQTAEESDGPVRHLRFETPLVVKMNGRCHEGIVLKPA